MINTNNIITGANLLKIVTTDVSIINSKGIVVLKKSNEKGIDLLDILEQVNSIEGEKLNKIDDLRVEPQTFTYINGREITLGQGMQRVWNNIYIFYGFPLKGSCFIDQFWIPEMTHFLKNDDENLKNTLRGFSRTICQKIKEKQIDNFSKWNLIYDLDCNENNKNLHMYLFIYKIILEFAQKFLEESAEFKTEGDCILQKISEDTV